MCMCYFSMCSNGAAYLLPLNGARYITYILHGIRFAVRCSLEAFRMVTNVQETYSGATLWLGGTVPLINLHHLVCSRSLFEQKTRFLKTGFKTV